MAFDRHGMGLTLLRILLGVFFLVHGIADLRWLLDPSLLSQQLATWSHAVTAGSMSALYLRRVAMPFAPVLARLIPLAEIGAGFGMIAGFWTPLVACVAFVIVLNDHVASGAIFRYSFLANPDGLPVLGGTLALMIGGVRLPLSVGRKKVRGGQQKGDGRR
jgi:uncharacterized membrane protein YphA (DoxX/SURF4 family)